MSGIFVIIPAYNSEKYLSRAIESVINQVYEDWKLIVLDDGSSDATFDVARRYAGQDARILAYKQTNSGVAATRSNGFDRVSLETSYVLFLDNDDYLEPDALTVLRDAMVKYPEAIAVYGLARDVDTAENPLTHSVEDAFGYKRVGISPSKKLVSLPAEEPDRFENMVLWPSIATPGQVLIRADALRSVGPFDPYTVPSDDWDMWIRLSLLGPIVRILRFTINKRSHESNVSKKGKVMALAEPRLREKLVTSDILTIEQKKSARLAHFYSCIYKLSWCSEKFQRREYVNASKTVYYALRSYVQYLRTPYSKPR